MKLESFQRFTERLAIMTLLALALFAVSAFAQTSIPAPKVIAPADGSVVGGKPPAALSVKSVESAEKISPAPVPTPVPAEMQELLADRDLLSAEIVRIVSATGDAVKIPVSVLDLQARYKTKTDRYAAWLDAQKIPREWRAAGWRLDKWVFIPPAAASSSSPSNEGRKSAEPPKPEAKKP